MLSPEALALISAPNAPNVAGYRAPPRLAGELKRSKPLSRGQGSGENEERKGKTERRGREGRGGREGKGEAVHPQKFSKVGSYARYT